MTQTISNLDLALLSLHWVGCEDSTVIVLTGDGKLLPQEFAERLIDLAWDKIARFCASRGYIAFRAKAEVLMGIGHRA